MAWNPLQYERYEALRWRPARDLVEALPELAPGTVADLGCGTGRLARLLAERYSGAAVSGIDSSPEMLAKARGVASRVTWVQADVAAWRPAEPLDLCVSNAALHWVGGHDRLFPALVGLLAPGGVLAVQMPCNEDAPSHALLRALCAEPAWAGRLAALGSVRRVARPEDYYRWLRPHVSYADLWTTAYLQPLVGPDPVLEWIKGTTLVPILDRLDGEDRDRFLAALADRLRTAYPAEPDGTVLFPFSRLFVVARKPG